MGEIALHLAGKTHVMIGVELFLSMFSHLPAEDREAVLSALKGPPQAGHKTA